MKTLLLVSLFGAAFLRVAADEPAANSVRQIQVEIQIIALPIEDALPLIEPLRDDKRIEKTVTKLHEMIANKNAKLIGWPMIITKSGNRADVECIDESTIYESIPRDPTVAQKELERSLKTQFLTGCQMPTFEMRYVGVTLEIEPTISTSESHIDIQLIPQHVSLTRTDKIRALVGGKRVIIEQPTFHTNQISTTLTLSDGQRILLDTFNTSKPEGWMELFILKASIIVTK